MNSGRVSVTCPHRSHALKEGRKFFPKGRWEYDLQKEDWMLDRGEERLSVLSASMSFALVPDGVCTWLDI